MKSLLLVFILVGLLTIAHCFPGDPSFFDDSDENVDKTNTDTILVLPGLPRRGLYPSRPIFEFPNINEDEDSFGFNPFTLNFTMNSNPFDGLLESMHNAMNNLKARMSGVLSGLPEPSDDVPEGSNTTSTTKVIGGHRVTINETTYKSDDNNTFFRFRIVDVKPENATDGTLDSTDKNIDQDGGEVTDKPTTVRAATESTKEETTPSRSVETVEDLGNNEIPEGQVETLQA